MKKKWMQQIVAAALTLAMCLTQGAFSNLGGIEVVKAEGVNLLVNGDFESENKEITPWIVNGKDISYDVEDWAVKKGNYGLQLNYGWSEGRTSQMVSLTQIVSKIPKGEYEFSISMAGTSNAFEQFGFVFGDVTDSEKIRNESTAWNDFKTYSKKIIIDQDQTNYTVGIAIDLIASDSDHPCVDDISLIKIADIEDDETESSGTIIKNGDFEDGINNWEITGLEAGKNYCIKKSDGHNSNDVEIWRPSSDLSFSLSQEITIPAGTYTLSIDSAGNANKAEVKVGNLVTLVPNWSYFDGDHDAVTKTSDKFQVVEDTTVTVSIEGKLPSEWDGMYFDNIVLNKIEAADKSKLVALVDRIPADLNGFEASVAGTLTEKLAKANLCLANDDATSEEVGTCYDELEAALNALKYEDNNIFVEKINGIGQDFIKGVDISSYLAEVESGVVFRDWNGNEVKNENFIKLLADSGVNYIRLRVWNQPSTADGKTYGGGHNDLATTIKICEMIKKYNDLTETTEDNIKVLIDLQYSDFWADPEKQAAPKAWENMDISEKCAAVRIYTTETLAEIAKTGVEIGMVQIGNETNTGICGAPVPPVDQKDFDTAGLGQYDYVKIFQSGCEGVDEFNKGYNANAKKVVHFTDPHTAGTFYAELLLKGGVNYDVYATSYYPFWHGTTDNLKSMLTNISKLKNKSGNNIQVMVAETQYVHTNEDYDGADNQAYEGKNNIDLSGWPVSLQGQANEIHDVIAAVAGVGENGIGMFYWEPGWLGVGNAYDANGNIDEAKLAENKAKWETYGSGWATDAAAEYDPSAAQWGGGGTNNENASLFDFYGNPLSTLNIFKYVNYGAVAKNATYYSYNADEMKALTVEAGTSAQSLKDQLTVANPTVGYVKNDKTTGTAAIVWNDVSCEEIANKIKTTSAIGNSYLVKGTITVDGKNYSVTSKIFVEPDDNLVANGGFESDIEGWTVVNGGILYVNKENPRNGSSLGLTFNTYEGKLTGLTADLNGCYSASVTQTISDLKAGVYEVKSFFEGASAAGSNPGEALFVKVAYGDKEKESNHVTLKGWMEWQCAEISDIIITQEMVKNKTNTISLSICTTLKNDVWGSVDDIYLYKVACDEKKTVTVRENEKAATYTQQGSYDEVVYCAICGEELSRVSRTIDKLTKPSDEEKPADEEKPTDTEKPAQKPAQNTNQPISVGSSTTNADGSVTKTSTVYDKNGTVTTTEVTTHVNGTVSETKTTTVPGVSVTTVETTKNTDGSSKTKEVVANVDGSVAVTTTTVNVDGSAKIVAQKNAVNDFGNVQERTKTTNVDAAGVVTGITEKTVIPEAAKNTEVSVVVKKTGADAVTSAKATVETTVSGSKATILGAVVNQVNAAAGTDTEIMVKVSDKNGKTLYKLKADSSELKAGNTLYAYQLNTKTGEYTVVNAKTYKVNKNGSVAVDMTKKATFELVSKKEAAAIDKQILSTVKVKKASASVKAGKKTSVAMSSKLNMSNVKSITYKTSEASVATVSKSGKITAKQAGTTVVKATVTLKNGKKKTVKMTITVK